jgi:hypothetical protein
MTVVANLNPDLLRSAKWAFTTRRVRRDDVHGLAAELGTAVAGDVLLCEILELGQHKNIQLADRRNAASYPGDLVVLALGDRYAPDQFLARATIEGPELALAAGGGVAGTLEAKHDSVSKPTALRPLARLTGADGKPINVADYALAPRAAPDHVTVFCVVGASMNSGKTTAAAALARGLSRAGRAVAGIKATGTGAFGDFNAMEDAGVPVSDFTDAGMATTFRMPLKRIEAGFATLLGHAVEAGAEICIVELADGLFQHETRALLRASTVRDRMDGLMLAVPDALAAYGGATALAEMGLRPFALSGMVSCSPLAAAEAAEVTKLPVHSRTALCDPAIAHSIAAPYLRAYASSVIAA